MIKVNDEFFIEGDLYSWQLTQIKEGTARDGSAKEVEYITWHPTLEQVCNTIVDRSCIKAENIEEIKEIIFNTKLDIKKMFEEVKKIKPRDAKQDAV